MGSLPTPKGRPTAPPVPRTNSTPRANRTGPSDPGKLLRQHNQFRLAPLGEALLLRGHDPASQGHQLAGVAPAVPMYVRLRWVSSLVWAWKEQTDAISSEP